MSNDANLFMPQKPLITNKRTVYLHFDQISFTFLLQHNQHPICAHFSLHCSIKKIYKTDIEREKEKPTTNHIYIYILSKHRINDDCHHQV